jgi:hypothetical protein
MTPTTLLPLIEAGTATATDFHEVFPFGQASLAIAASNGDVSAAIELAAMILPRWNWLLTRHGATIICDVLESTCDVDIDGPPARALLIATIKAMIQDAAQ